MKKPRWQAIIGIRKVKQSLNQRGETMIQQTVRWRLYQIAGKIVYHSGQTFLKARKTLCLMFKDIRLRIWEFDNVLDRN